MNKQTSTKVYDVSGKESGEVKLNPQIFGVAELRTDLVHQTVYAMLSSSRNTVAHTKNRGEVRGGGRKPWQQKGTGRARAGSIRSPLWKGGGVTFGPRSNRNFTKQVNKAAKRLSLFTVFTDRAQNDKIFVIDKFTVAEPKTKLVDELVENLRKNIKGLEGKILVLINERDENLLRAAKNLSEVNIRTVDNFNILDVLSVDSIIVEKGALSNLEKIYLK